MIVRGHQVRTGDPSIFFFFFITTGKTAVAILFATILHFITNLQLVKSSTTASDISRDSAVSIRYVAGVPW